MTLILRTVAAGGLKPEFEHPRTRRRRAAQTEKDSLSPRSRQINERPINVYGFSWKKADASTRAFVKQLWRDAKGCVMPMAFTPAGHTDSDTEDVYFVENSLKIRRATPTTFAIDFVVEGRH